MGYSKSLYTLIEQSIDAMFTPRPAIRVNELRDFNIDDALHSCYAVTTIQTEQKLQDGTNISVYYFVYYSICIYRGLVDADTARYAQCEGTRRSADYLCAAVSTAQGTSAE
jgi:hypothetical protein